MQLQIDKEQKEIKSHGSYEFPLRISHERLSWFDTGSFPWHWHTEIELTLVLEGNMAYQVNEHLYRLEAGDGLFCNTNMLHTGHRLESEDCHYLSVTFHPRLLYGYGSSILQSKYVEPILKDKSLSSLHFHSREPWMEEVLYQLRCIYQLEETRPDSVEIRMQICLLDIWRLLYENVETRTAVAGQGKDTERIRRIIGYIQAHYTENITLDELAAQVHLCRSECCRMFRRYMQETMFDYLIRYRLEQSLTLLRNTSLNITQIAQQVGFATPGYYSRLFKGVMGCTPVEYRRTKGRGKIGE